MVTFDHLCVLTWRLGLQLRVAAVKELRHLFRAESFLSVCDEDSWSAERSDPVLRDGRNESWRILTGQERGSGPANGFVQEMGDHSLLVEEYVPLDGLVELLRKSSVRDGLGSWPFPHAADLACVDYLRQEFERGGGRSGVLEQSAHLRSAVMP